VREPERGVGDGLRRLREVVDRLERGEDHPDSDEGRAEGGEAAAAPRLPAGAAAVHAPALPHAGGDVERRGGGEQRLARDHGRAEGEHAQQESESRRRAAREARRQGGGGEDREPDHEEYAKPRPGHGGRDEHGGERDEEAIELCDPGHRRTLARVRRASAAAHRCPGLRLPAPRGG
jgi:hypothetical protein